MDTLYSIVKETHSGFRWIVLVLAIAVAIDFIIGWTSKKKFARLDNTLSLLYMISCDIQLLIGLSLYFFLSPVTQNAMQFGLHQDDPKVMFFGVEHPITMILAIACAHVGRATSKKATTDSSKFKRGTIWFVLSLILLLARMPW
jgi:NADH:ubiquinone oxidoreductase subunit H